MHKVLAIPPAKPKATDKKDLAFYALLKNGNRMATRNVILEIDALEKLEAAKLNPQESLSEVVRRAQFPFPHNHTAQDLLKEFAQRHGCSPLSDEALDQLAEAQRNPRIAVSHWAIP